MAARIPPVPRLLGWAGVLPQAAACLAVYFAMPEWRVAAMGAALGYAALIFTFLGGTWWGMAATAPAAEGRGVLGWVWVAAIMPSLISFAALAAVVFGVALPGFEPLASSLLMLGGLIGASALVDSALSPGGPVGIAPQWWPRLRWPLSLALGSLTMVAGLG